MTDKLPPFHGDHEAAALGCVLDCDDPVSLFDELHLEYFYDERHRAIYTAMQEVSRDSGISLVSLCEFLMRTKQMERCGGIAYIQVLPDRKQSNAHFPAFLESLQDHAARRAAIRDSQALALMAADSTRPWRQVQDASEALALTYADKNGHNGLSLINAADFMAHPLIEPDQIIRGILHRGSKFCIGGASKACKTWALLDLALSVSNQLPWMSFGTTHGKVLYLNFEIQDFAWQKRIRIVADKRGVTDLSNITLLNLRGKTSDFSTMLPNIADTIKRQDFSLVIIDPIYKLYGRTDENNARDVAALLNGIEHLCTESNAAAAYASHFSKGNQAGKEAMDRVSGSGVFARDPDALLILTKHAEEDAFTVESILRNFAPVNPFVVKWQFPLLIPDETLDPEDLKKPGGRPASFSENDVLLALGQNTLTSTEWCQKCSDELGISRRSFYRSIKALQNQDLIIKSKINDKWSKLVSVP